MSDFNVMLKNLVVLLADHRADSFGPPVALSLYLKKKCNNFSYVSLPLGFAKNQFFYIKHYIDGNEVVHKAIKYYNKQNFDWHGDDFFDILRELSNLFRLVKYVFQFKLKHRKKFDFGIGADPTTTYSLIVLKKIGLVRHVIYANYNDPTPKRSQKKIVDYLFTRITKFCYQNSDYVWYRWENHKKIVHKNYGLFKEKNTMFVPIGLYRKYLKKNITQPTKLVCARHIAESSGIQLIISALPKLIQRIPELEFFIIGDGQYLNQLKKLVYELHLEKNVKFLGFIPYEKVLAFLPTCDLGIATYVPTHLRKTFETNSITEAMFGSVSTMDLIGAGLPIIITNGMGISSEISVRNAGISIKYDVQEAYVALNTVLTNYDLYKEMIGNVLTLGKDYEYETIFDKVFQKIVSQNH